MAISKQALPVKKGDVLGGKYRVEKVLGVGGMGVVVAARHVELHTLVALKFMLPDALADSESVERFSREARAAVQLTSEHAVRVSDVGKLKNGAPYMVMELLVGEDLGQLLDKLGTSLPVAHAVDYLLQASEAIAEAHALHIVHRDLKPRNIFLAQKPDGRQIVKVLDFGLAKSIQAMSGGERALTRTTAIMGSPQYMSPEQMRASRNVDARTDLWSLGACLYELLTGRPPFDAPTLPELCAMVLTAQPTPPHLVAPHIPLGLSLVVMTCLEKEPLKRFSDLGELAAALEEFASEKGAAARVRAVLARVHKHLPDLTSTPPPSGGETLSDTRTASTYDSKPERTRRLTVAAVAALTFAVVAGVGILIALPGFFSKTPAHEIDAPSPATAPVRAAPDPSEAPSVTPLAALPVAAAPAPVIPPRKVGTPLPQPPPPPRPPVSAPRDAGVSVPRVMTTTF